MNQSKKFWRNTNSFVIKTTTQCSQVTFQKNPRLPQCLFNCNNKKCKLCALYIKPCASSKTSKNVIWYIRSPITCKSKNVIYFLKCSTIPHTNSETNPLPRYSMLFASTRDSFLAQDSMLLTLTICGNIEQRRGG